MYLSIFLIYIGCALATNNIILLCSNGLNSLLLPLLRIKTEEALMIEQFPGQYEEYQKQVRYSMLPGVW